MAKKKRGRIGVFFSIILLLISSLVAYFILSPAYSNAATGLIKDSNPDSWFNWGAVLSFVSLVIFSIISLIVVGIIIGISASAITVGKKKAARFINIITTIISSVSFLAVIVKFFVILF